MPNGPHVGLQEVDKLIMLAMERGYVFPAGVKRWQLLAWAAEAVDARRTNPASFERGDFAELTERHFPGATTRSAA